MLNGGCGYRAVEADLNQFGVVYLRFMLAPGWRMDVRVFDISSLRS